MSPVATGLIGWAVLAALVVFAWALTRTHPKTPETPEEADPTTSPTATTRKAA